MVAEPVRETGDLRRVVSNSVNSVEVETSRIIKKIAQRNETNHPRKDQPGDQVHQDSPESGHQLERGTHIKIMQNQYSDQVVDVTVVIQRQLPQNQNHAQTKLEKETR